MLLAGLSKFIETFFYIQKDQELRAWYGRSLAKTFLIAILILLLIGLSGSWAMIEVIMAWMSPDGVTWAATTIIIFLFWIALIYFSGTLTFAFSNVFVGLLIDEDFIIKKVFNNDQLNKKWSLVLRSKEMLSLLLTVFLSILCLPLFLIPFFIPLAILLTAWRMGTEAYLLGQRMAVESKFVDKTNDPGIAFKVGLGLLPAIILLVPAVGWMSLPVLMMAGAKSQILKSRVNPVLG